MFILLNLQYSCKDYVVLKELGNSARLLRGNQTLWAPVEDSCVQDQVLVEPLESIWLVGSSSINPQDPLL